LLKAGAEGGAEAAHKLMAEIKAHIQSRYEHLSTEGWNIVVHIYASLEGLARKFCSIGILKAFQELYPFTRAFNQNQPLFNITDVGFGKERADHKIRGKLVELRLGLTDMVPETLRLFLSNRQCKHIVFGGCHDNGYLPTLESYRHDPSIASRISLLESTQAQPGFQALNLTMTRFSSVFRSEPLPDKPPALINAFSNAFTPASTTAPAVISTMPAATTSTKTATPPPAAPASDWATVGKTTGISKTISIAPTKGGSKQRRAILLNQYEERLDPKLANPDRASQESFSDRISKKKVCNFWHLSGNCENYHCPYSHEPKLSQMELLALRHRTRKITCPISSDCRDIDCYLGHMCNNDYCYYGDNCHFADTHGMDKVCFSPERLQDAANAGAECPHESLRG